MASGGQGSQQLGAQAGERQVTPPVIQSATQPKDLPQRVDVVVIGGGIIGCSTAWFLSQRGLSVALCEKGNIACEQSSRNWGWVRKQGRAPQELPIMLDSQRIWDELSKQLQEDIGFERQGCYYLAPDAQALAHYEQWLHSVNDYELDSRLLTASQMNGQLGTDETQWHGALFTPSDGRAEPSRAAQAIARGCRKRGVSVLTGCAVRGLQMQAGAVSGVVTEHGSIRADAVVCAGGAWTSLFCANIPGRTESNASERDGGGASVSVPQLRVKGTVARLAPSPRLFNGTVYCPEVALRRRADGGYTVAPGSILEHPLGPSSVRHARQFLPALRQEHGGLRLRVNAESWRELRTPRRWQLDQPSPFEARRILHPQANQRLIKTLRAALRLRFPALGEVPFAETWAGMIDATPDVMPIMSAVDTLPGYYIATGFSGHGFGIGPGAGRAMANLVTGHDTQAVRAFTLARFSDGSPIRPGPSI